MRLVLSRNHLIPLFLLLATLPLSAAKPIVTRPHHDPAARQSSEGAFWRSDRGFDSYLRLKNVLLKSSLTVTPVVYMADGFEVDLAPITLEPAGVASINLRTALADAGFAATAHASSYGMAGVKYQWGWSAVLATVQNIDEVESLTYHSSMGADAQLVHDPSSIKADRTIHGLWWAPHAQAGGFVALVNTGRSTTTAQMSFHDAQNHLLVQENLSIAGHATSLLSLENTLTNVKGIDATGSITIAYNGVANSLLAYEGIEDRKAGYSASPVLAEFGTAADDAQPAALVTLDAPGIMIGPPDPTMLFPALTVFQPYAYLYNTADQQLNVTVSLIPLQGGSPIQLGTISLAPGSTVKADIAAMMQQRQVPLSGEYANFVFTYQGHTADLTIETGSVDQTRNYVFEVPATAQSPHISKTICYWTTGGDNDTMISVRNYSAEPSDELLTFYFARGQYKYPIHLAAGETRVLSVHKIQNSHVPDEDGHILPSNITEGSALLASASGETKSMAATVTSASFNVRNATCNFNCTTCNGISEFVLSPQDLFLGVDYQSQMQGMETYNTQTVESTTTGTWTSGMPSIATVSGNGMVTGVSAGQTGANLSITDVPVYVANMCTNTGAPVCPQASQMGAGAPVTVQIPTDSRIVYTTVNQSNSCPAGQGGWKRMVTKVVTDQNGVAIATGGASLAETVNITASNGLNLKGPVFIGTVTTNDVGQFGDIFSFCSPVCAKASSATTALTQTITDTQKGVTTPLRPIALLYSCGNATLNGK